MSTWDRRSDDYDFESVSYPLESGEVTDSFFKYRIEDPENPEAWVQTDNPASLQNYRNVSDVGIESTREVLSADYTTLDRWSWDPAGRQMIEGNQELKGVHKDWTGEELVEALDGSRQEEIEYYVTSEPLDHLVISAEYPEAQNVSHNDMPVFKPEEVGLPDNRSTIETFMAPAVLNLRLELDHGAKRVL